MSSRQLLESIGAAIATFIIGTILFVIAFKMILGEI